MALEMPLEWLLGLVATGVPLAILLAHLHGGSAQVTLDDPTLDHTLAEQLPGKALAESLISADRHTALLRFQDGSLGIAWSMERHAAARELGPLARLELAGDTLTIRMQDPAWAPRQITASPETLAPWMDRLRTLGGRHAA